MYTMLGTRPDLGCHAVNFFNRFQSHPATEEHWIYINKAINTSKVLNMCVSIVADWRKYN